MIAQKKPYAPVIRQAIHCLLVPLAFFLIEVFAFIYIVEWRFSRRQVLPLMWGFLWSLAISGVLTLLPRKLSRAAFGVTYLLMLIYSIGQTGYYLLFSNMMWLSDFRYASEGANYLDVLTRYPKSWFVWAFGLIALWLLLTWKYPRIQFGRLRQRVAVGVLTAVSAVGILAMPRLAFSFDNDAINQFLLNSSVEATYTNMRNPLLLYQICGIYHTPVKDLMANEVEPRLPWNGHLQEEYRQQIQEYFDQNRSQESHINEMTGLLEGKNVVLVLLESLDDWMVGEHTPVISRLMAEGINFTNFYTPPYGGVRTFNTELCMNTGSYLSSQGGYAFEYVENEMDQSLAAILTDQGYTAKMFHYNDPEFYGRNQFFETLGYDEYVYYFDHLTQYSTKEQNWLVNDDTILFTEPGLRNKFFRGDEKLLNFIIPNAAHLTYNYDDEQSVFGLKKYPQYRGLTGSEETDCSLLKAKLLDDMFQSLLDSLEEEGQLDDTVIIGITDHYAYGYQNERELMELSGVDRKLLLEKTPCFIWAKDLPAMEVNKTLNTSDLLPTVLNLLGIESGYDYIGRDAFDESYEGYALFSDGSWITQGVAWDASDGRTIQLAEDAVTVTDELRQKMSALSSDYVQINNLILESDYYAERE